MYAGGAPTDCRTDDCCGRKTRGDDRPGRRANYGRGWSSKAAA